MKQKKLNTRVRKILSSNNKTQKKKYTQKGGLKLEDLTLKVPHKEISERLRFFENTIPETPSIVKYGISSQKNFVKLYRNINLDVSEKIFRIPLSGLITAIKGPASYSESKPPGYRDIVAGIDELCFYFGINIKIIMNELFYPDVDQLDGTPPDVHLQNDFIKKNSYISYAKLQGSHDGTFKIVPNDTIICFMARLNYGIDTTLDYRETHNNFLVELNRGNSDLYCDLFKYREKLGENDNGYFNYGINQCVNAFKDCMWYYPTQIYQNLTLSVSGTDFDKCPPSKNDIFGYQMCYYDVMPDNDRVEKTYYKNTDQLQIETIETPTRSKGSIGIYETNLEEFINSRRDCTKKYNLVIVNASRYISINKSLCFDIEMLTYEMNKQIFVDCKIVANPILPTTDIHSGCFHLSQEYLINDSNVKHIQSMCGHPGYSSVIPSLMRIYDDITTQNNVDITNESQVIIYQKDYEYLCSVSINKILLFCQKLQSYNGIVGKAFLRSIFKERSIYERMSSYLNTFDAIEDSRIKFYNIPLKIENMILDLNELLSYHRLFDGTRDVEMQTKLILIRGLRKRSKQNVKYIHDTSTFKMKLEDYDMLIRNSPGAEYGTLSDLYSFQYHPEIIKQAVALHFRMGGIIHLERIHEIFRSLETLVFTKDNVQLNFDNPSRDTRLINNGIKTLKIKNFSITYNNPGAATSNIKNDILKLGIKYPYLELLEVEGIENLLISRSNYFQKLETLHLYNCNSEMPINIVNMVTLHNITLERSNMPELTIQLLNIKNIVIDFFFNLQTLRLIKCYEVNTLTLVNLELDTRLEIIFQDTTVRRLEIIDSTLPSNMDLGGIDLGCIKQVVIRTSIIHANLIKFLETIVDKNPRSITLIDCDIPDITEVGRTLGRLQRHGVLIIRNTGEEEGYLVDPRSSRA